MIALCVFLYAAVPYESQMDIMQHGNTVMEHCDIGSSSNIIEKVCVLLILSRFLISYARGVLQFILVDCLQIDSNSQEQLMLSRYVELS